MKTHMLIAFALLGVIAAGPASNERIVGGSFTTIDQYPSLTPVLYAWDASNFWMQCAGAILNTRSILSCAHCYEDEPHIVNRWRVRVGSTLANSGGTVHNVGSLILHPQFNINTYDNDIAIIRTATPITYIVNAAEPAAIAGPNYNVADNQVVWATGWGADFQDGWNMETLRHVQIWTINQATCVQRYATINRVVTDNMLCSGWLDVGGRNQCHGDDGAPLLHNNVVVGVCSWRSDCDSSYFPGVNTRVNRYTSWIQANA